MARLPKLARPTTPRAFSCRCGRPIFFRNSICLACQRPLGYDPIQGRLMTLELADQPAADAATQLAPASATQPALWREAEAQADGGPGPIYLRCSLLNSASACNWLVDPADTFAGQPAQCRCCRLTRTLPDLSVPDNAIWWGRIELAKRRLVSSLFGLQLPVQSRVENPEHGLAFDLLRNLPGGPRVMTGHDDGVITLDVEEADDSTREKRRGQLHEPYRTLLGHLRHESGHYYWQLLVDNTPWLEPCRAMFGDDRIDYAQSLQRHYAGGPPPMWSNSFVSSYASSHPWEDWAETWAHYLHLRDTLDTANSFGLDGERVELTYERYGADVLEGSGDPNPKGFLAVLNGWMELTGVLNELSRSMGMPDFYPFVVSIPVVRKLHFVHRVVMSANGAAQPGKRRSGTKMQPPLPAGSGNTPAGQDTSATASLARDVSETSMVAADAHTSPPSGQTLDQSAVSRIEAGMAPGIELLPPQPRAEPVV